ncbi:MAG: hypothetical protein ACJ75R_05815 [Solirubrobacterales bacterium]
MLARPLTAPLPGGFGVEPRLEVGEPRLEQLEPAPHFARRLLSAPRQLDAGLLTSPRKLVAGLQPAPDDLVHEL